MPAAGERGDHTQGASSPPHRPAAPTCGREALREHLHGGDARHLDLAVMVPAPVPVQKQEPAADRGVRATASEALGAQRQVKSTRPHLWLLERRQTIVSGFSEFPKVTRKVAPAEGPRREHAAAPAPPPPGEGRAEGRRGRGGGGKA